jgi:hypothetical protein
MNRSALFFGLSSVVALAGLVGACSSTTTTVGGDTPEGGTPGEAGIGKEAGSPTKDSSTPVETDSSVTPTGDDVCAAEATRQACGSCCIKNHPAGAKAIQDSVEACACKGTGADGGTAPCMGMTECGTTFCAATPAQPNAACNTCLQASLGSGGACQGSVSAACSASPDCVAEQKCITPCQTKN